MEDTIDRKKRGQLIKTGINYLKLSREDRTLTDTEGYIVGELGIEIDTLHHWIKGSVKDIRPGDLNRLALLCLPAPGLSPDWATSLLATNGTPEYISVELRQALEELQREGPKPHELSEVDVSDASVKYKRRAVEWARQTRPILGYWGNVNVDQGFVHSRLEPLHHVVQEGRKDEPPHAETFLYKENVHAAIIAPAGGGKSILWRCLSGLLAKGAAGEALPVPINWTDAKHVHDTRDLLAVTVTRVWPACPEGEKAALAQLLEDKLVQGNAVALIDDWTGLHLMPEEIAWRLRIDLSSWPRVLIFGRYRPRSKDIPIAEVFQLGDLNDEEVRRFIRGWASAAGQSLDAEALIVRISSSKALRNLARAPWLLDLLCRAAAEGLEHLQSRWALLRWAVNQLLEREAPGGPDQEYFQEALAELAWYGYSHVPVQYAFDASEVRDLWYRQWGEGRGERFLGLVYEGGLLRQESTGRPLAFPHPAFQAVLAAEAWLERKDDWLGYLAQAKSQPAWGNVIVFAAAELGQAADNYFRLREFLERLCQPEESDIFGLNWLVAGQCLAELGNQTREALERDGIGDQIRRQLLDWLLHSPCALMHFVVRDLLAQLGTEGLVENLGQIASDDQRAYFEREAAMKLLGEIGGGSAIEVLIEIAQKAEQPVSSEAVKALGHTQDPAAIDFLADSLKNAGLRDAALEALAAHNSSQAARLLLDAEDAWAAIGQLDSPQVLPVLVRQAGLDNKEVDPPILSAIANIGGEQAIEALARLLCHEAEHVAEWAAYLLGEMKTPEACEALLAFAESEGQSQARRSLALSSLPGELGLWDANRVIALLRETGAGQGLAPTTTTQGSGEWPEIAGDMLDNAMQALIKTVSEDASDRLERALDQAGDDEERRRVAFVVARRGRPEAVPLLIKLARDPDPQVRAEAIFGLGKLRVPVIADVALRELQGALEEGRSVAELCAALGDLGEERAVPWLVSALQNNHFSRSAIITALGQIGGVKATQALVAQWRRWVEAGVAVYHREEILQALAYHSDPLGVQTFIEAATRKNTGWSERLHALGYLRRVHNPAALEVLIQALSHSDVEVRQYVAEALWGIGTEGTATERALLEMLKMASDQSENARQAARTALDRWLRDIRDPEKARRMAEVLGGGDAQARRAMFSGLEELLANLAADGTLSYEINEPRSRTSPLLCYLSLAYDIRVMPDLSVVLPDGQRLSWRDAIRQLAL